MKLGEIMQQNGIIIRGHVVKDTPKILSSILKAKIRNADIAKAQAARPATNRDDYKPHPESFGDMFGTLKRLQHLPGNFHNIEQRATNKG